MSDDTKIVDLQAWKEDHTPSLSGKAVCVNCRHLWDGGASIGTVWLECPQCRLPRGRFLNAVERDGPHWHCNCGCDLFYATESGMYCPNCGAWQHGF